MKRNIITAIAMAASVAAGAQSLTKVIEIKRDYDPSLRAATRLSSSPTLVTPEIKADPLAPSQVAIAAETGAAIDTLPAAQPSPLLPLSPYRGYASLGYFPVYNLGANAGYRIIDRASTSLGVWTQFNGAKYNGSVSGADGDLQHYRRNTVTAGADFAAIINRAGRLDISADFTFDNLRDPYSAPDNETHRNVTLLNVDAHWSARNATMAYFAEADYHNFAFSAPSATLPSQHEINARGGTAYYFDANTQLVGTVGVNFLRTDNYTLFTPEEALNFDGRTLGLINFAPAFRYSDSQFKVNIGFVLQFMSHMTKTINFAPDIRFRYIPATWLSAFANLTGGKRLNTFAQLWQWCPYINPTQGYGASNIPLDAEIGATVGPFKGFAATLKGGYSMANDWLMPTAYGLVNQPATAPVMIAQNLRAFHATLSLGWHYTPLIGAEVSYSVAPGSQGHAWYVNRDRAKGVLDIKVESRPLDRLMLDASFQLRHGRQASAIIVPGVFEPFALPASNSLDLGATYTLSDALSVFAQLENILDCKALQTVGISGQGIHGLVGASLKF